MENDRYQKLLTDFTCGYPKAFSTLFKKYKKAIKKYIASHCFGSLKHDIDDIEQETWIRIWEKKDEFDTNRSFYSFVCYWAKIMIKRTIKKNRSILVLDDDTLNENLMASDSFSCQDNTSDKLDDLFRVTFTIGGPPHQLIAFGFNKLLSQWKPKTIVRHLSALSLKDLSGILIKDYTAASCLSEDYVQYLFRPLCLNMFLPVYKVLEDEISRNTYKAILHKNVGKTLLNEYFSKNTIHNISDWTYKVQNRVAGYYKKTSCRISAKFYLKNAS